MGLGADRAAWNWSWSLRAMAIVACATLALSCGQCRKYDPRLGAAAARGNIDEVRRLLDEGVDINTTEPAHGTTALSAAIATLHNDIALLLLERGIDVNIGDPMYDAAALGDVEMAQLLLKHGYRINDHHIGKIPSGLYMAAGHGRTEMIRFLVSRGADVTALDPLHDPVRHAVMSGQLEAVKALLEAGAPADVSEPEARTALEIAREYGRIDMVELLRSYGARE